MKRWLLALAVCVLAFSAQAGRKKFIGHSWDLLRLSPEIIAANIDKFDEMPLDGISVRCKAKSPDGKLYSFTDAMVSPAWDKSWVEYLVPTLKKINGRRMKENLISVYFAPGHRLDWSDDERWGIVANNMGICAWLAKTTGGRGLMLDPEDYPRSQQYKYNPLADKQSYEETAKLARKRGRQIMEAIGREYPDAVVLSFWFVSMSSNLANPNRNEPVDVLLASTGNLWVPFINGLLDALPPAMRLVDGCEHAYRYDAKTCDFYRNALVMTRTFADVVAPENKYKYKTQMQAGFGLYLDSYVNKEGSSWYFPPLDGSRLNYLAVNFRQAMAACDEYCWVYGEKFNWVKWDYPEGWNEKKATFAGRMSVDKTWNDALPGIWDAMGIIRDPHAMLAKIYERNLKSGQLVNAAPNAGCDPKSTYKDKTPRPFDWLDKGLPPGWASWEMSPKGVFSVDTASKVDGANSVKAEGVEQGCLILRVDVEAGAFYSVEALGKGVRPGLTLRWQKDGNWRGTDNDVMMVFKEEGPAGWKKARTVLVVPEGVNQCCMLFNCKLAKGESVNYAKPAVYKLKMN